MENLRVTNYIKYRGARFTIVLISSHYCVSSLDQGGLEILCEVTIYLPPTPQNKELVRICDNLMRPKIYFGPASFINRSFLQTSEEVITPTVNKSKKKDGGENKSEKIKWTEKQKDIDNFFNAKCKLVDLHAEESVVI